MQGMTLSPADGRPTVVARLAAPRDPSLDIVKGIAITLVVLGHTLQGLGHRGWWNTPSSRLLIDFIYSFHMPAFFFVSGLLVSGSMARRSTSGFLIDKVRTILYPYLLWIAIDAATEPLTAGFRSTARISIVEYVQKALRGEQSWFLQCLFLLMVLSLLTRRLPDWLRALLAVSVCVLTPASHNAVIEPVLREWVFVAAGQLAGSRIRALEGLGPWLAAGLLTALAAVQLAAVGVLQPAIADYPLRSHALFVALGLGGTTGLFCAAKLLRGSRLAELCAWVGEASIAVYLLHPYFQGGTRLAIVFLFHTHRALPHLLLTTAVATLVPALIWHNRRRLHVGLLFSWDGDAVKRRS